MRVDTDSVVVGIDLDGCVLDYEKALAGLVKSDRGLDEMPRSDSWDFKNWDFDEGDFFKYHSKLIKTGGFAHLEMIEGAAEFLQRLSDEDYYIRIITHRLVLKGHHRQVVTDTVTSLDENAIPYRDLCFAGNKATVGADIYVDDAPHNYEAIVRAGKPCIMFDQIYNRHVDAELRAYNWNDVYTIVRREMER